MGKQIIEDSDNHFRSQLIHLNMANNFTWLYLNCLFSVFKNIQKMWSTGISLQVAKHKESCQHMGIKSFCCVRACL